METREPLKESGCLQSPGLFCLRKGWLFQGFKSGLQDEQTLLTQFLPAPLTQTQ